MTVNPQLVILWHDLGMDARDAFRDMLRDQVGPALRQNGFKGSGANWRLRNESGDWAVVNFQKSQWGFADEVYFYINLSLVIEPRRVFNAWREARIVPKVPGAYDRDWWTRLDPPPREGRTRFDRWDFGDGSNRRQIGDELVTTILGSAETTLRPMLDRDRLVAYLRDGIGLGFLRQGYELHPSRTSLALVLSDYGPSSELTTLLESIATQGQHGLGPTPGERSVFDRLLFTWLTNQTVTAGQSRLPRP